MRREPANRSKKVGKRSFVLFPDGGRGRHLLPHFFKPEPDYLCSVCHQRNFFYFFLAKPACMLGIPAGLEFTRQSPAKKIYQHVMIENSASLIAQQAVIYT